MDFFSSLQFAGAGMLGLALAAPLLVLAYLFKKHENHRIVPSLLILRQLKEKLRFRRRIKLPLRFFLELASLLLLTAAAARPFITDDGSRTALLLDNSLSMQARTASGASRLDAARDAADDWFSQAKGSYRYDVYSTSPRLRRVAERVSASGAKAALSRISSALSSDPPASAIAELARSGQYERVVLLTDHEVEFEAAGDDAKKPANVSTTETEVVTVGEAATNLFLSTARIETGESKGTSVISAVAAISGPADASAVLKLYTADPSRPSQELQSQKLSISPGSPAEAVFEVSDADGAEAYQLRLAPLESGSDINSVKEDDAAYLTRNSSSAAELLLISPAASEDDMLGLDSVPGLQVSAISPERFAGLPPDDIRKFSLLLFHRSAPRSVPRKPTMLILPPAGNPLFPVLSEQQSPSVSSWAREHPITAYLRVPLLSPKDVVTFSAPPWSQAIINVEKGALVVSGESGGFRFAGVGMELLPFEGMRTPSSTVLTLNILSWLSGGTDLSAALKTGHLLPLKDGSDWRITDPAQQKHSVDRSNLKDPDPPFTLALPGLYTVTNASKPDEPQRLLAANSLFSEESSTFDILPLSLQRSYVNPLKINEESDPLWPALLIAAFALLALEYILRAFRREQ